MSPHVALAALALLAPPQDAAPNIESFRMKSELLSEFHEREVFLEAGVVIPPELEPGDPVCFNIHGFGGSHRGAWTQGKQLRQWMETAGYPRMLYVYPNANGSFGHTGFADSENNGPWARAFVEELLPAIEAFFGAGGSPAGRFLTGHSSGGWAALWLQVTYPETFGGAWASAPDPVDFRDMSGIDLYTFDSAFVDPDGAEIPVIRQGGVFVMTVRQVSKLEQYAAQLTAFEAAYGPRGEDGRPRPLFDRESGAIEREVVEAWSDYDIRRLLARGAGELREPLAGKLHVFVGNQDTVRLEGAVRLLETELDAPEWGATFEYAEGRDHFDLLQPHADRWPEGLLTRIHREMRADFARGR
jgi:pimeloyl-ACP methyl ester carboxylesterase